CEQCLIFEFVGEFVEPAQVEAWSQSRFMSDQMIRLSPALRPCQRTSQGVINDLLHRPSLPMHRIIDQAGNVRIQRQGRSHVNILVLRSYDIKMLNTATSRCQATQNSLPSGSAIVIHQCGPCEALCRNVAPRPVSFATSNSMFSSPTLTSRCHRFFTVLFSGTSWK